ncbi:MAG: phage terminase large subunit family protein [Pirellulales bacterium]
MTKQEFCERFVVLNRERISFAGRPYLPPLYDCSQRNLVLRCSRRTEKSTFLANTILYTACKEPGAKIIFVSPRHDQSMVFSTSRLLPMIENSPVIRRVLLGRRGRRPNVTRMQFDNGSAVFVRAAFQSADAVRGLSGDLLLIDEFQDVAEGDLPVLQETLSHAKNGRTILTGTPKLIDNHLEAMFRQSTANEWTITCGNCGRAVILDERSLGPRGVICPSCSGDLDPTLGRWVPKNPQATWGEGFWICHPMVPWLNYDEILERQRTYDLPKFKNEVLGLSTTTGEHVVTREELEACCTESPMTREILQRANGARLMAGIDWGGGGTSRTVLVIGHMRTDYTFQIGWFERFAATEDPNHVLDSIARRCNEFGVFCLAADGGGNGYTLNRLLRERVPDALGLYGILYSAVDHEPYADGMLTKWTVNRSGSIGALFSRVKKKIILFPRKSDCNSYLDEFACEVAEYDDHNRTIKYTHPDFQPDDALHATNYALLIALRGFNQSQLRGY